MFTGIITDIGEIIRFQPEGKDVALTIRTSQPITDVALGASIACDGICLTVTSCEPETRQFTATASEETARVTTLSDWHEGRHINLERALRLGDELGGHLVTGHVDGVAHLLKMEPVQLSWRLQLQAPADLARFIARKGSVALDGISLTVNAVEGPCFSVNIIPHTWQQTTLSQRQAGEGLNLEVDMMARYLERLQQTG